MQRRISDSRQHTIPGRLNQFNVLAADQARPGDANPHMSVHPVDSVTSTFTITLMTGNSPPLAANDVYTTPQGVGFTTLPSQSVLSNDIDPNGDPITATLVDASGTPIAPPTNRLRPLTLR